MTRLWLLLLLGVARTSPAGPEVTRLGYWQDPPTLRVCEDYRGDRDDVKGVVRKIRAHSGALKYEEGGCTLDKDMTGEIWLAGSTGLLPLGFAGLTFVKATSWGKMIHAVVFVDLNYGSHVLEHELLHAMGLAHIDIESHVMSRTVELAGDNPSWVGVRGALKRRRLN